MSLEYSYVERQLLEDLATEVAAGEIVQRLDLEELFQPVREHFPWLDLRIDWSQVKDLEELKGGRGAETLMAPGSPFFNTFWADLRKRHGIDDDERILVCGDMVGYGLEMSVAVFSRCVQEIFGFAMHWFAFPPGAPWCLSYTMEDDAFFGWRPNVVPMPWTEKKLREVTKALRDAGEIHLVDSSVLEFLAQHFPMQEKRLQWQATSSPTRRKPKRRDPLHLGEGELEEIDREWVEFWQQAQAAGGLGDEDVLRVGGPQLNICFDIPARHLPALLPDITTYLQETHLLRLDPSWCMSYLAEGEVVFGVP